MFFFCPFRFRLFGFYDIRFKIFHNISGIVCDRNCFRYFVIYNYISSTSSFSLIFPNGSYWSQGIVPHLKDEGKNALAKEMGFSVPFTTFGSDDQPDNPLTKLARAYSDEGKVSVTSFPLPSQQWQDDLTSALLNYVQGGGKWSDFENAFTSGWKKDWDNNKSVLGMLPESKAFDAK